MCTKSKKLNGIISVSLSVECLFGKLDATGAEALLKQIYSQFSENKCVQALTFASVSMILDNLGSMQGHQHISRNYVFTIEADESVSRIQDAVYQKMFLHESESFHANIILEVDVTNSIFQGLNVPDCLPQWSVGIWDGATSKSRM
ncbi:TPA_asm: hypothetical protein [Sphaeridiorhabdovirus 3]|nr:TPA_asm: hypothetical protein [Sphaeridiorhabdovirus 3]